MCGSTLGIHCGSRKSYGFLSENCSTNHLYVCNAKEFPAEDKGICNYCSKGTVEGSDYCAFGKKFENFYL